MIGNDRANWKKLHTRLVEVTTYADGEHSLVVEGRLRDERHLQTYNLKGESHSPGAIHDLVVRMRVRGFQLIIDDIETELPTVPREECHETATSLDPVKGMAISPGFTEKVKALVGGTKGCAHLVALLLAMAPAAVQGAWVAVAQKPSLLSAFADKAMGLVVDTCRVWRRDGPLVKRYLAERERSEERG